MFRAQALLLTAMKLTLTGSSTALFSTWYFLEEYGILFDAGDGVVSALNQKLGRLKHAFISHEHRDHLSALYRLNPLNENIQIYYPKDAESFEQLEAFSTQFDADKKLNKWTAIKDDDVINIRQDLVVKAIKNNHILDTPNANKSLSYKLLNRKQKLKLEYSNLSSEEIRILITNQGKEHIMQEVFTPILTYSGDTPVGDYSTFDNSNILIHEATFIDAFSKDIAPHAREKHSSLEEVMEMAANIKINTLVLGHFSLRYSLDQIDSQIRKLCTFYGIKTPVYRVAPGQIAIDILNQPPLWE